MKKIICIAIVGILTLIGIKSLDHGGRTDSQGGHHDRKKGTYHYHR